MTLRKPTLMLLMLAVAAIACNLGFAPDQPAPTESTIITPPPATTAPTVIAATEAVPTLAAEQTAEITEVPTEAVELEPEIQQAVNGVSSNFEWAPYIYQFDGIEMALVPAGCFMMGNEVGDNDERPVHEVCLEPFWIAVTEVTNGQFGANGSYIGETRPHDEVSWFEAVEFCESRGERLPTEAEWEYAARGPDGLEYPWGNEFDPATDYDLYVFSGGIPTDVGSMPAGASWVGALDLISSLREWTNTIYRDYPYDADDGRETHDVLELNRQRVIRGGSFNMHEPYEFRATFRQWYDWNFGEPDIGFRCVRDTEF